MGISRNVRLESNITLGFDVSIWDFAHIRENVTIDDESSVGEYCYIGPGVKIGKKCKIQNAALIYEHCEIDDGVFIGPNVIIANDLVPRAVTPNMKRKIGSDWLTQKTKINEGASIGASAVIVSPKVVGRWAMVGAGAIVTKDVPDFALVVGNPARQIGWVGKNGLKLQSTGQDVYVCPISGEKFFLENFIMRELL